jgi:hypothetical protein
MESVYISLNRYVVPTLIILGTIGGVMNQLLFYFRKPLRATSCALYFRALSANDLLVLWFVILQQWIEIQFQLDATVKYDWYCKLDQYLTYIFYTLSPYFTVLACLDRLCTSSTNARLRKIATIRIASYLIPSLIILVFIGFPYLLVWSEIVSTPTGAFCAILDPKYSRLLVLSLLIFYSLIPPLLMIIFCSITVILLRQQRHRIMPVNQARLRHRDHQLIKMLFIYVTSNIICILPFSITFFLQTYYHNNPSPLSDPLVQIFTILVTVAYTSSFYVYTLGTPYYRDELFNLLKTVWHRIHRR